MQINTTNIKHDSLDMSGLDVLFNEAEVVVNAGSLRKQGEYKALPSVSFDFEEFTAEEIIYDLYIVEENGELRYELLKTYPDNQTMPAYEGTGSLVHTFITIHNKAGEEGQAFVYNITKVDEDVSEEASPDETTPNDQAATN